jgi:hypothetical protein
MEQINTGRQQGEPKHKQQHIEWRRNMCLELSSQGRTEREIAQILKMGNGTVHRDIAYLNKQAHDNLKNHINHRLPQQYQRCSNGLEQVLRMAWNIVVIESINQANKLQALSLISDCYRYQMDLSTNAGVISKAMNFVNRKTEQLNTIHKQDDDNDKKEPTEDGTTSTGNTTNGVF